MSDNKFPFSRRITKDSVAQKRVENDTGERLSPFAKGDMNANIAEKYVHTILPVSKEKDEKMKPPTALAQYVVQQTATNIMDNENILQLLPDMELAMQVLISSILAPNNMMTCELNYVCDADDLGDLKAPLVEVLKEFFDNVYKINSILPTILEDVLFRKGAYPLSIIPETSIDDIINGSKKPSMESLNETIRNGNYLEPVGLIGNSTVSAAENFFDMGMESLAEMLESYDPIIKETGVYVTDNVDILKFPTIHRMMVNNRISKAYQRRSIGLENDKYKTDKDHLDTIFHQRRQHAFTPVVPVKTLDDLDRATVGHPLVLNLPPESVIVVHVPSEPKSHIGYYVALDRHGNPIRANASPDYFADFSYNSQLLKDMSTQLLAQTRRNSEGRADMQELMLDDIIAMYTEVTERDIRSRLRNGVYGDNIEVSKVSEAYRTMLFRKLAGMQTQLLFIPVQLMTYIAFDYNYHGNGKSLLETTKILSSIRAMMLFANTMAAIKNSTNHVQLNLDFDPEDPDPRKTAEMVLMEYAKVRQSAYPIGASNPLDMVNYIQNAGVTLTTNNHPNFPQTKLSIEDRQTNRALIDTELDENLKKRHLSSIGIAPETVDLSMNVDFAQSIVNSNILLAKRALVYQKLLTGFVSDFIAKFTTNSSSLMQKLLAAVEANRDKIANTKAASVEPIKLVHYFITHFRATLPEPDMTKLENQKTAFELYSETLDAVLPAFISSEMFDASIFGELSNSVDNTIAILKAYFQRRWLQNNDVTPEVFEILEKDREGKPILDVLKLQENHMQAVATSLIEFMKIVLPKAAENTEAINKLREENEAEPPADSGGGDDSGGDEEGGDGGDDMDMDMGGGDDDFSFDEGGGDEATDEEPVDESKDEEPAKDEADTEEDKKPEEPEPAKEEPAAEEGEEDK